MKMIRQKNIDSQVFALRWTMTRVTDCIYFIPTKCTILKVLAQHVSDVTAPIIRSTTVV
jgi:hypothetical protein